MNKLKLTQPAFPSMPLQDSLGRMIIPNAGLSRLEYFSLKMLEIFCNDEDDNNISYHEFNNENGEEVKHAKMNYAINYAITFLEKIDKKTNEINDEKTNTTSIIQ